MEGKNVYCLGLKPSATEYECFFFFAFITFIPNNTTQNLNLKVTKHIQ